MAEALRVVGGRFLPSGPSLADLRQDVRRLEMGRTLKDHGVLPLGLPVIDETLPGGGLALGALHEIEGERPEWDDGLASGFCLLLAARLLARRPGPLLWISQQRDLYIPGLLAFGINPARLILVAAKSREDLLWAFEEALRASGEASQGPPLAGVVAEGEGLDRLTGRRLQLAAEESGHPGFFLHRPRINASTRREPSGSYSRWRIGPADPQPETGSGEESPGNPGLWGTTAWSLELLRCRSAAPGHFRLSWPDSDETLPTNAYDKDSLESHHAPYRLSLATALCHRTSAPAYQARSA